MTIQKALRDKRNEISDTEELRDQLWAGTAQFRAATAQAEADQRALAIKQAADTKAASANVDQKKLEQRAAEDKVAAQNDKIETLKAQLAQLEMEYRQGNGSIEIVSAAEKARFGVA